METTALVVLIYGALVLAGGVMGYVKAKSLPSLISGLAFGLALLVCGLGMLQGARASAGAAVGLAVALLAVMGIRFAKTKKFMPAGLIALLSVIVVVMIVAAMRG